MRSITKGREPPSLTEHRASRNSNYGNYAGKDDLRRSLVEEQRGLCCYCMKRITADADAMKIEHWKCQSRHEHLELDYGNILGACPGGEGLAEHLQHCDTRKASDDLKWNPAVAAHGVGRKIRYEMDGRITCDDEEFRAQLDNVLGLNLPAIKNRRKGVLDGLLSWWHEYHRTHHRRPPPDVIIRKRNGLNPEQGHLQPFAPVGVFWLDQKLAGANA